MELPQFGFCMSTGKSSLVRYFGPALQAVIQKFADPALLVRFVKQNVNKPLSTLNLEFDLRPNNNDMSVMSIIQGRRLTLRQSKPGLVVVALEELAAMHGDPDQLSTCQLISQRFAGRKGAYNSGSLAPKNGNKLGISGDATIISLFTSNYLLEKPCKEALLKLEMFENLICINVEAVSGLDRKRFAHEYLYQQLSSFRSVELKISLGEGDTRKMVRCIRMLAYFINLYPDVDSDLLVTHEDSRFRIEPLPPSSSTVLELTTGNLGVLCPKSNHDKFVNQKLKGAISALEASLNGSVHLLELRYILSFWLAGTLSPTVIVSSSQAQLSAIKEAIATTLGPEVGILEDVDASAYKMVS